MVFIPPRARGLIIGVIALLLVFGLAGLGMSRLASAPISPFIVVWVIMPLVGLPLGLMVAYRLYGLLTARYRLDRDGLYIVWGQATEHIPLSLVKNVAPATEASAALRPRRGLWWPGCIVGKARQADNSDLEFFATGLGSSLVLVNTRVGDFAISPKDPGEFGQAFVDATRMGSLNQIQAQSRRPDYFSARMWNDLLARGLVLAGLVLDLLLLGFLAVRASALSGNVPFGFDPSGVPGPMVPPGRLLLLPLIAGFCWLGDLGLGAWLYRREREKPLAYAAWGAAVLVGGLFWGATLQLLAIL